MSKNRNPTTRKDTSAKPRKNAKEKAEKEGVGVYNSIPYESFNELHFLYWAEEMKEAGYILDIERAPSYMLTEGYTHNYTVQNKKGTQGSFKAQTIIRPSVYTPEFILTWNKAHVDKLIWLFTDTKYEALFIGHVSDFKVKVWIEVKPHFNARGKTTLFVNNQKFLFKTHGIYVNLVKIPDLFEDTFTPKLYLKTATGKDRKINFEVKTLNQFITNV